MTDGADMQIQEWKDRYEALKKENDQLQGEVNKRKIQIALLTGLFNAGNPFIEKLAFVEHERWSGWMEYLFSKCTFDGGAAKIPKESVDHWQRQCDTTYDGLSEREKESDRVEVRKTLTVIRAAIAELLK